MMCKTMCKTRVSFTVLCAAALLASQPWLSAAAETPKGYLVGLVTVTNKDWIKPYRAKNNALLKKYGGRILVRGQPAAILEGNQPAQAILVVEFPSVAQAKAWYADPDYQPLITLRQSGSQVDFIVMEQLSQ